MKSGQTGKDLYKQLRALPWARLWTEEVARFERAGARERFETVAVIRAVGVVFSESGPAEQANEVRQWLRGLLRDPEEKVRRYAMAALPKIGASVGDEAELLALLRQTTSAREEKFLGRTLDKVGGAATLETIEKAGGLSPRTEQRVKASVARSASPSAVRLDAEVRDFDRLRIHLRGRRGLEGIVREEVEEQGKFRVLEVTRGLVAVAPLAPFTLADVFALRCFDTAGFVLGLVKPASAAEHAEALASVIASPLTQRLLDALTAGSLRYRLEFIGKGHQRGAVRLVADRAYAACPRILNDAREAPWAVDIHATAHGDSVELRPRLSPDPRHTHRLDDVPAASHPPLAACMARLAGRVENESVWDPFCGSGLELIERTLRGGVRRVFGTDRSAAAIGITGRNFAAARLSPVEAHFLCGDFRDFQALAGLAPGSLSLIITNPPLGRRVRIPNLRGLFDDLFAVAARMLQPGGRLVFTNPFRMETPEPALRLQSRQVVDLGGFDCRVEVYRKAAR
jgi:23S rRNA G2445 N2-methylase RlmL